MSEQTLKRHETERISEIGILHIATLGDLGLGTRGGIRSNLSSEARTAFAHELKRTLVPITHNGTICCIDGRCILQQLDGGQAFHGERQAGGRLSYKISAIAGTASCVQSITGIRTSELFDVLAQRAEAVNLHASSHTGGCAAALMLPMHLASLSKKGVAEGVQSLLSLDQNYFGTLFNQHALEKTIAAGYSFAQKKHDIAWDKGGYTDRAIHSNPAGVSMLETADDDHHGHREQAIVITFGDKTVDQKALDDLRLGDVFVITADTSKFIANELSDGEPRAYNRILQANLAFHLAVASNICDYNMPIIVIDART